MVGLWCTESYSFSIFIYYISTQIKKNSLFHIFLYVFIYKISKIDFNININLIINKKWSASGALKVIHFPYLFIIFRPKLRKIVFFIYFYMFLYIKYQKLILI